MRPIYGIVNTKFRETQVRLLASTDYALRLLMRLATEPGRMQTSEELAQGVGVPRNHIQKIVQDLAEAGVVRTTRGARGGVCGARAATAWERALGAATASERRIEHLEFRRHVLKRFTSSVLWLTLDVRERNRWIEHTFYAVAAAQASVAALSGKTITTITKS